MKKKKIILIAAVLAVVLVAMLLLRGCKGSAAGFMLDTAVVSRTTIVNTVTATGTLQAVKTVDVGTQVSGVISHLYADYNSHVTKGQLLAELDKTPLLAALNNAQASLDDAMAEVAYKTSMYNRTKALFDKQLVAQSDYDEVLYAFSKAKAAAKLAQSNYDKAQINLNYATIYSPIDGVVLSRKVSEGQTVAANFSAPTLFSIANDLTQMQVEANIDEADIGLIKQNQAVVFTVDAFQEMQFKGVISEIRLQSVTTSNVVTYTVIVTAANPDKKLMPGMTATIEVSVETATDVLAIPFKATQLKLDTISLAQYWSSLPPPVRESMPRPTPLTSKNLPRGIAQMQPASEKTVWVKDGFAIRQQNITTGVSDDLLIEVKSGLKPNDVVITGFTATATTKGAAASSPFMPKPPKK